MATAGNFTSENEYFCRCFRLVNETGAKSLRKILEASANADHLTIEAFLLSKKSDMEKLFQKSKGKIIQKHQLETLYPKTGLFHFENLDISLLCVILHNTCNVSTPVKEACKDIRNIRNELCHKSVISLTRLEYYSKFSNVHKAIKALLQECQDVTFETEIENEIKNIDESPFSVERFKEFLHAQDSKTAQAVAEKIRKITEDLYAKVEKMTAEAVQNILHRDTSREDVNEMVKTLKKQTEAVLKRKSEYVLTQQFVAAENMLMSSGSVVISGGTGEGKTFAAYEIMRRNGQENNCIQIHSPDDVRLVDPRIFDFVFIDDIFGNYEVDESKLQSWIQVMETLQQLVSAKAVKLIITTREIVLKECKNNLEKFSLFNNTVSLSSKYLSKEEKTDILENILKSKNKFFTSEETERCVMTFSSDLGFPYTCVLFASDENFFRKGASFFKHNPFMNLDVFTKVHDCKHLALLFLWIKDATNPIALNRSKENDVILRNLSRMLDYKDAIDMLYDRVNEQCKIMEGVFVNAGPYGYQFTHNAVYQAIGYHFARLGHYDFIIEHSNLAFFMEAISVTEDHYQSDRVFIRNEFYQNLVERMIIEVIERNHRREMALHPCLTTEIIDRLFKTLKREKKIKEFFSTSVKYSSRNTFLPCYLETCAIESCTFLKHLLDHLKCPTLLHNRRQCKTCDVYLEAYHGACRGGNINALKILNFVKCDSTILRDAAYSGNILMYEYIVKVLGPKKDAENEKQALYIAVENHDIKMFDVIRQMGCMPDSKCLMIASKIRNSALIVHILRDMHFSDSLHEDNHVKYTMRTIFSMDVLQTLILVELCPTIEDIVRSITTDFKAVETILWDLKYKVNAKPRNIDVQLAKLWGDIIEDSDLNEKLEEIGLLKTSSYLNSHVEKGNTEKVKNIIQHFQRNNDWDPNAYFAVNLLNLSLPDQKDMFIFLLNIGISPRCTTLYKSDATKDIKIVRMTLGKMKETGQFDRSDRRSKQALLQSTLSYDIYNYLIDEGIKPKAYHLLYTVESDVDANTKIEVIKNVYLMAEKCECLLNFDEKVMELALLGAFDDSDVYTCLLKKPFKLQSSNLPTIISRGSVTQVERFIADLKVQEDWPPSFDATKLSLECSFYNPGIFETLMKEDFVETIDVNDKLLAYRILFECRKHSFHRIKEYVSILQNKNIWNKSDIVLKCSLLESKDDQATCELFEENGVVTDDILDTACETGNSMLQSYITAYLSKKGHKINLKNLDERMIKSLSSFPLLCTGHLLKRAVCVSDREVVMNIFETINKNDPHFVSSELASNILELSSVRLDVFNSLLKKGCIPTIKCLLTVVKKGSYELFHDTIYYLNDLDKLPRGNDSARKLVHESLKRDTTRFYITLTEYGIKGRFEDIIFAINSDNIEVCYLIANDLQKDILEKCVEGIDVIILKCFPLYRRMHEKGLQLTSSVLLKLTYYYLKEQISFCNIRSLFDDYFSGQLWSFEDDNLLTIYKLSLKNKDLFPILDIYFKSEKESYLLKCLMSRDKEAMEKYLNKDSYNAKRVLPGVIRKSAIFRKRIDKGCIQLMMEWIKNNECDPNLRILSSVLYSDTENTLQILYEFSEEEKATLDIKVLETALEEAIFSKKIGLYLSILNECRVKPTTYCLLYSIHHNIDNCFKSTLKNLPKVKKTCRDPYYKVSLALCCQKSDLDKLKTLLTECKSCDTELLIEAVLSKNELIFKLVKDNLIKHNQWDFSFKEYWLASALIEADDNPSIKSQFESYYDDTVNAQVSPYYDHIPDESITIYTRVRGISTESTSEDEDNPEDNEVRSENDYQGLDSFISHENAYLSLQHIQLDEI